MKEKRKREREAIDPTSDHSPNKNKSELLLSLHYCCSSLLLIVHSICCVSVFCILSLSLSVFSHPLTHIFFPPLDPIFPSLFHSHPLTLCCFHSVCLSLIFVSPSMYQWISLRGSEERGAEKKKRMTMTPADKNAQKN